MIKIKMYDNQITMLFVVKGKLLLSSLGQIFVVKKFTVEDGVEEGLFGRKKKVKYITDIEILTYSNEGKFLGLVRDNNCESMLRHYDFYIMRQQWVDFMEQLKSFGFKIVKIDEENVQNI
jgi:hypothetical protein